MEQRTNLRALRHRYGIYLPELSAASGLSIQYLSRAELGKIPPTPRLEEKMGAAVANVKKLRTRPKQQGVILRGWRLVCKKRHDKKADKVC